MVERYMTVSNRVVAEMTEKRSRFICSVAPVEDEEAAVAFIEKVRAEHRGASHNVFAYAAGLESLAQRYSDDGEPSGTAGLPVMGVLSKQELRNVAVVVTRYFGGVKLGAPGLVRAYTASASAGVAAAGVTEMRLCRRVVVRADYTFTGKLMSYFKDAGLDPADVEYTDRAIFTIDVELERVPGFIEGINEMTASAAVITLPENEFRYSAFHNFTNIKD